FLREVYRKFGRGKNEERKGLRGFIGISDLIKSKAAANRKQDSADLDILRAAQHKRVDSK
ncbi:MAG: hypothetical protein WAX79_07675, partial [Candidatus Omnitrophota bacterium]